MNPFVFVAIPVSAVLTYLGIQIILFFDQQQFPDSSKEAAFRRQFAILFAFLILYGLFLEFQIIKRTHSDEPFQNLYLETPAIVVYSYLAYMAAAGIAVNENPDFWPLVIMVIFTILAIRFNRSGYERRFKRKNDRMNIIQNLEQLESEILGIARLQRDDDRGGINPFDDMPDMSKEKI